MSSRHAQETETIFAQLSLPPRSLSNPICPLQLFRRNDRASERASSRVLQQRCNLERALDGGRLKCNAAEEERATSWDERKLRWAEGPGQRVDPRLREPRVAKDELAS